MSKSETATTLRYGQGILIKGYKEESGGILTAKGFADTRARFETYDDILYFKNYRNAIFQILPASSFDINDQLRYLIDNNLGAGGANLEILRAKASSERDQFDLNVKSKENNPVCFGEEIVFKHIDSGTFLAGTITPSDGSNGAFSVEVTNDLRATLVFKLLPYRSFENESNPIPLESPILIENVYNKGYLTFEKFGLKEQKEKTFFWDIEPIKSDESYRIPVKTESSNSEIYECVTHFADLSLESEIEKMPWKFQLHFNEVDNDSLVQHDIVYFQHTMNNGVLSASGDEQIFLKELKGEKTSELCFYDCLWEIEEHKEASEDSYILRHLMSGMTLGVQYSKGQDGNMVPLKPKLSDISEGKSSEADKLGVIELRLAKKEGGIINSKSYINIMCGDMCLDIAKDKEKEMTKRENQAKLYESEQYRGGEHSRELIDLNKMATMAGNEFNFETKKLEFTLDISKHCFVIQEIDESLKSEVLFALSFHSRLINLREDLKWGAANSEKKVSYQRMMQVTEKAKQIKYFLKNTTKEDPNRDFKRPLPKRQIICFHLGISQLLLELLFFMRKNRDGELGVKQGAIQRGPKIFVDKPNEEEKFIQMYNSLYEVVFELIRDNTQFKIHVSKWIGFIFEDVMRYNEEYQLKTLRELLEKNSFFVNNFVNAELIEFLVDRMLNNPEANHEFHEKKYIEIFRAFCICGSEVNSENQDLILAKFFKKLNQEKNGYKYEIKMGKKKNQEDGTEEICCCAAVDKNQAKWRRFEDYYKICRDEYQSAWSYLNSYLNLIADMTQGRNKTVQNYIQVMLTQDVLSDLLINNKLYNVEAPVIRIMHYLYAESQRFYPIDRITRVLNYNKLDQAIKLNCTKSQVRPKDILGSVMNCIIQKLKHYGSIRVQEQAKNECLEVILDFLRETFVLGFWDGKADIVSIFQAITRIITPPPDINYTEIREQSQKPEVIRMISCKEKCMEIIECIIDLDIDFNLKIFSNTFKSYQLPSRKIEVEIGNFLEVSEECAFAHEFLMKFQQEKTARQLLEQQQQLKNALPSSSAAGSGANSNLGAVVLPPPPSATVPPANSNLGEVFLPASKTGSELVPQVGSNPAKEAKVKPPSSGAIVSVEVCKIIIELSKHNHPGLTSFSLKILQRILDMNKNIAQKFFEVIFVCESNRILLNNFIWERRDKFFTLEYQNTVKINTLNQKNLYFMMYRDEKESGIMQDMYMISELVKNQSQMMKLRDVRSLDSSGTFKDLGREKLLNFTSERRSSNNFKQQVAEASNIHLKVLRYIFNCKEIPADDLAVKLLHLSYKFLVSIIQNNQEVKLTLIEHIPKMIHHVQKNLGCIDFLKEMYDNNRNMLYNDTEIIKLIKVVCDTIEGEDMQLSFYKSKLLDFFRYLIYCNGRALSYNQIQILKIMQDDSYSKIIIDVDPKRIGQLVSTYEAANRQADSKDGQPRSYVVMEPELVYLTTYFQVMVSLIDDKCKVNSGKLIKKFPFDKLIDCIQRSSKCWPLKRNIRAFMNRLYYFEPEIETYMSSILNHEVVNIIKDFNYFIEIKCKSNANEFEALYFQNPVRFSYLESYLYLNLEENLFTLHQLVRKPELLSELKNFLHSVKNTTMEGPYNFIRICERLGWIRNYFTASKNIFTTSFIKFLLSKLKAIIEEFDDNVYTEGMMFSGDKVPTKQEKDKARKYLIEKIMIGEISSFFVQQSPDVFNNKPLVYQTPPKVIMPPDDKKPNHDRLIKKLRQILTKTKREFTDMDEEIRYKQNKLISALKMSPQVKEEFIKQYNSRLEVISKSGQVDKETGRFEGQSNLLLYISSIIEINSSNPDAFPPDLKIFFLKMIIGIVEHTNSGIMEIRKPIDQWESDEYFDSLSAIQAIQLELKSCQVGTLIAELLKESILDNIPLANNILLCGIAYLLGGNATNQKNMMEEILKDPDNRVFRNIQSLITKLGKLILKNIDESNYKPISSDDFEIEIIDNYDFYNTTEKYCQRKNVFEPNSTNQIIYHQECIITYRRAFKFLQLLCENNNVENKNFVREQPGKLEPINFINITTTQLRNLFEVICRSIVEVPEFLLDFLIEITQIPVKLNQEALMNSSFFEDLCQMGNELLKAGKLATRSFEEGSQPLQKIFGKSVQIILSNFEGNDETTYRILDSKLDPKLLTGILESRFEAINVHTKSDLLEYIKSSLEKVGDDGQKKIETMYPEEIMGIFQIIIIFKKLEEKLKEDSRLYKNYQKFKKESEGINEIMEYLEGSIIHIQINDNNNHKQTIFFPKQPAYYSLSANNRDYVMSEVKRETHRDKIVSLLGYTKSLKRSMDYSYTLKKTDGIVEKNMTDSYKYAAFMSCVVCVFLMFYYNVVVEFGEADFTSNRIYRSIRLGLSLIQLSFACVYAYYWYILKIWYKPQYQPKEDSSTAIKPEETQQAKPFYYDTLLKWGLISNQPDQGQKFYNNGQFYRLAFFVGVSFLGTFFHPPLFFIHIIDILCQSDVLANIFQAIGGSAKSLVYVSFMGVVFTLIFCTVSFSNYMKDVYAEESDEMCDSMMSCMLALFVSGAIGETMAQFQLGRFAFDTIYAIFFGLLFGNIVSGIMLDAFGGLRETNEALKNDKSNFCYICNVSRENLEKKGIRFKDHIVEKHFLWNYIFYIISLTHKNSTDYTGLEYEIVTQYNQTDEDMKIDWVPDGEEADYNPTDEIKSLIKIADEYLGTVDESLKELNDIVGEFNAAAEALAE